MKSKILILIALLISSGVLSQEKILKQPNSSVEQKLNSISDTLQYAIGAYLGQWMVKNNFEVRNATLFLTGMEDVLKNRDLAIPDSTITPLIAAHQQATQNQKNKMLEEQLFATLKGKAGVGILPNGVHYIIRRQGEGVRPNVKNTVVINAVGVLPDGTIFEDTYKKKQPITMAINTLIPGLNEAIQLMPIGSVWRIFIPSALAYGETGLQNIVPPHSAIVYDIELIEIKE